MDLIKEVKTMRQNLIAKLLGEATTATTLDELDYVLNDTRLTLIENLTFFEILRKIDLNAYSNEMMQTLVWSYNSSLGALQIEDVDKSDWCCDNLRYAIPFNREAYGAHYGYVSPKRWAEAWGRDSWYKGAEGPGWFEIRELGDINNYTYQLIYSILRRCPFCGLELHPPSPIEPKIEAEITKQADSNIFTLSIKGEK